MHIFQLESIEIFGPFAVTTGYYSQIKKLPAKF